VIAGATKATYTPTTLDVGKVLKVRVALKATGYAAQVAADAQEFVATAPVGAPQPLVFNDDGGLSGTVAVGRVVKVSSTGTWSSLPTSFTYQWDRNSIPIPKATAASYTLTAADLGAGIQVHIFAHLGTQVGLGVLSFPDPVVTQPVTNVTPPTIPISARVGVKLTAASVGTWDLTPTAYTYQWYVNNTAITNAKTSSYTPIVDDLGEEISVRVTAKRTGFADSVATSSNKVTVLEGAAVAATKATSTKVGTKVVTTVKAGQTVLATPATWPNVGSTITQGWQVSLDGGTTWQALTQAGTSLLVASPLSPGDKVRFAVTATRAGYAPTTSASPALTIVP
jgi:hypothetical protein